jgi:hypothetical protein
MNKVINYKKSKITKLSDDEIIKLYTNPELPGAFTAISGFKKNTKIANADKVLNSTPAISMHKPILYKFPRAKTQVNHINEQWQADLIDMSKLAGNNAGHTFILTVIDVFSKKAYAQPLINKSASNVKKAFENIFEENGHFYPKIIYTDEGNEFRGECETYLKSKNIEIYKTKTKIKAAVVERFNRTLKARMFRYFTYYKSQKNKINLFSNRWLHILPKLITSYNNSYHRSIKNTPNSINKSNEDETFLKLYGHTHERGDDTIVKIKYKVGSFVRRVADKTIFQKSYEKGWENDVYVINRVLANVPIQ